MKQIHIDSQSLAVVVCRGFQPPRTNKQNGGQCLPGVIRNPPPIVCIAASYKSLPQEDRLDERN